MGGTSRNLDLEFSRQDNDNHSIRTRYQALVERGIDLLETDLPRLVWPILYSESSERQVPGALRRVQLPAAK